MRGPTAVVLEVVAGPDRGVGFVERQFFALSSGELAPEETSFPREVTFDNGPNLASELEISGPLQMAEKRIDVDEVHVVV